MKKKLLIPIIMLSCALMMSACGKESTTTKNTTPSVEDTDTQVVETPVVEETEASETTPVETEEVEETTTPTTTPEATTPSNEDNEPSKEETTPSVEQPKTPVHTHNYSSTITSQPGCTTKGVRTYTCECGKSYTESIPATNHNFGNNQPTCSNCGANNPNYQPPHTHNYTGGDCSHPSTCSCGATGTYGSHKWTNKTWTEYIDHESVQGYCCLGCGFADVDVMVVIAHIDSTGHMAYGNCIVTPGWIETIEHNDTVCEICGAHQ